MSPASCVLLAGLILTLFSWLPGPPFRLDQYDLPKDLVLGAVGVGCAVLLLLSDDDASHVHMDVFLAVCVSWAALLAWTTALNATVAWRAVGFSCAAFAVFLLAWRVGARGNADVIFRLASVILAVLGVVIVLEAIGAIPFISAPGRRPGAMLGNRNLAARVVCLSLPLLWRQFMSADRTLSRISMALMLSVAAAAIVLSRSRGVWLVASGLVVLLPAYNWWLQRHRLRDSEPVASSLWFAAVLFGATTAVVLPNRLSWQPRDFASSASAVGEFRTGTGRGRLIQAETTVRMIRARFPSGAGPGNWSITYPAYAQRGDPSVQIAAFYPAPLVPRNDLLSLTSELGIIGCVLSLVAFGGVILRGMQMSGSPDRARARGGVTVVALAIAAGLLGLLDSVLRTAPTVMVLALLLGLVLGENDAFTRRSGTNRGWPKLLHQAVLLCAAWGSSVFAIGALQDVMALRFVMTARALDDLTRAVAVSPHNMEARMLLAYALAESGNCELANVHLTEAARLQPYAIAVNILRDRCDGGADLSADTARESNVTPR